MEQRVIKKKQILLDEMKRLQVCILKDLANFCDEKNIKYFLGYGTLLGAIRHKGFIPWDDDIDIIMPRPDYNEFLKLANGNLNTNYHALSMNNTKNYIYPFAKIIDKRTILKELGTEDSNIGVCIDIFPVDGLPEDIKLSKKHFKRQAILLALLFCSIIKYVRGKSILSSILKLLLIPFMRITGKLIGTQRLLLLIDKTATKYAFDTSEFSAVTVISIYGERERIKKGLLTEIIRVEFEGEYFNAPIGYHEYLTNLYQDYMRFPPESKRVSRHKCEAYWR